MSFLDNVERGLEKVVTSFFRGNSSAAIKPVELTTALRNEMDRGIMAISEGRSLAPNDFVVRLSADDYETAKGWGSEVVNEMAKVTADHAVRQGYSVQDDIRIHFVSEEEHRRGEFEIAAAIKKGSTDAAASAAVKAPPAAPVAPTPAPTSTPNPARTMAQPRTQASPAPAAPLAKQAVLEVGGQRYALHHPSIVLGRSNSTDIPIEDPGVSRQHFRVEKRQNGYVVVDLGSTNGTYVDGRRITGETRVSDGSVISLGKTKVVFRLITHKSGGHA
ncbi:DUF3662 and FHA domain-containing protein [Glutamicibacter sp. MNS18]|uniref:FhaA domain-containing protein n=1 Tax=Glutamicibacter sp. MNS18 TaxID=2989817 RepID=UPI0022358DEA|nr:DUF3662 and FHA domain-containing protein [Glutamicibacter sp. MNS18]MCW4466658.1 DUF3662 and FHA domain-containing protein [Glutamicibacter sp. MNS18]